MRKFKKKILSLVLLFVFFIPVHSIHMVFAGDFAITKVLKIPFVGDYNSGKTALRAKLTGRYFNFDDIQHTQSSSNLVHTIDYNDDTKLCCMLWDNSGQTSVKEEILKDIVPNSQFVVIVVGLTDKVETPYTDVVDMAIKNGIYQSKKNTHP